MAPKKQRTQNAQRDIGKLQFRLERRQDDRESIAISEIKRRCGGEKQCRAPADPVGVLHCHYAVARNFVTQAVPASTGQKNSGLLHGVLGPRCEKRHIAAAGH